jgi:hypothetical protein
VTPGRRRRVDNIPGEADRHCRREHPYPAPAQGVQSGEARRADGLAKCLHRMRRRRPPQRPAAGFHHQGNRAASRRLRYLPPVAHDEVHELQRPAAGRVRLPGMRSRARRSPLGRNHDCGQLSSPRYPPGRHKTLTRVRFQHVRTNYPKPGRNCLYGALVRVAKY